MRGPHAPLLPCALVILMGSAAAAPPADPGGALSLPATPGFALALVPRPFVFPQDHAAHEQFRQEWWYFTGHLEATGGERFGFELTFFRFALAPPAAVADRPVTARSAWRTREIYMAHFAVTDIAGQRFEFAQKLSRAALGLAGAQDSPLKVWIDDWTLAEQPQQGAPPHWQLHAAQPGYELQLDLEPGGAPVPNGNAGLSVKSAEPGAASYYYSLPRIAVKGTLVRAGAPAAVTGLAWFDHEWGSGALGTQQAGWDWFALQLDDGSALMFYALRDRAGARDAHSAGTYIDSAGASRALTSGEVQLDSTGAWVAGDGVRYPSGWRIRVPALDLDLTAQPLLKDQELRTTPRYWEGAVQVHGTRAGAPAGGRGYVELVGYAQERCPAGATGAHGCVAR
jgi:predicted secreted hydrolase